MSKTTKTVKTTKSERRKVGVLQREGTILSARADDEEDDRRVEMAFSSEEPVERWFGEEVLDHRTSSIRMDRFSSGRAPLLVDHDTRTQVGVIEKVSIGSDRVGRAVVRFGETARAEEELREVRSGIRANVSFGYRVHRLVLEEVDNDADREVYRAMDWEPLEISIVSVPADPSVGIGRDADDTETVFERKVKMDPEDEVIEKKRTHVEDVVDANAERSKVRNAEKNRMKDIQALGRKFKLDESMVDKAIDEGTSSDDFSRQVLDHLAVERPSVVQHAEDPEIGLSNKEVRNFSFLKALNALANPKDRRAQEAAGFEFEVSQATAERMKTAPKGLMVPSDIISKPLDETRAPLSAGTPAAGGNTVATDLLTSSFIDLLRAKEVLSMVGATYLTGLNGNLAIPKHTVGASAFWIATEGGDASETAPEFGQVPLSPKTLGAFTDVTRNLLIQSSMDMEAFVRGELAKSMALEISRAAFYGSGAAGQPEGVVNKTGINTTTFAAANPTWQEVVAMETAVAADDADMGALAYVGRTSMRGHFKSTEKFAGTGQTIWEQGGTVNGYPAGISNQIVDGDHFYGNWADVIIGLWGGLDLLVDPYTNSRSGTIRVVTHQSIDEAIRNAESICFSNDTP